MWTAVRTARRMGTASAPITTLFGCTAMPPQLCCSHYRRGHSQHGYMQPTRRQVPVNLVPLLPECLLGDRCVYPIFAAGGCGCEPIMTTGVSGSACPAYQFDLDHELKFRCGETGQTCKRRGSLESHLLLRLFVFCTQGTSARSVVRRWLATGRAGANTDFM